MAEKPATIKLRIVFDGLGHIGHGRIELLELIGKHGSIAKAAKAMDMSYKRAWYLIDEFSAMFSVPLVERHHGGKGGGAAVLTDFGETLVREYRAMEQSTLASFAPQLKMLQRRLRKDEGAPPKTPEAPTRRRRARSP